MAEIINAVLPEVLKFIGVLIGLLLSLLLEKLRKYVEEQKNSETIYKITDHTVKYVEQVYKDIHGQEKLLKAKEKIIALLAKKKITLTDEEIEILIESAVNTMNSKKED